MYSKMFYFLCSVTITLVVSSAQNNNNNVCGTFSNARHPKIVGGKDGVHGQYPWMISLRLNRKHHCGGALINRQWIVTAAHCVARQTNVAAYSVKLGGHYRTQDRETHSIEIPAKIILGHEGFSFQHFGNDIALVKLERPVDYTAYIRPICMPTGSESDETIKSATVIGWGRLTQSGTSPEVLQQLDVPIVSVPTCQQWYKSKGQSISVRPTHICAGVEHGGKDACQGDSGGPLFYREPVSGQTKLIGVVSAGIGCALPKLPGLYTRVSSYLGWINQHLSKYGESDNSNNNVTPQITVTTPQPVSTTQAVVHPIFTTRRPVQIINTEKPAALPIIQTVAPVTSTPKKGFTVFWPSPGQWLYTVNVIHG